VTAAPNTDAAGALTPQQARFVAEYLIDLNATQAAIRAGYSARTAESQGSRLLSNAKVSAAIAEGQKRIANTLEIDAGNVLRELARIAFADIRKVATWTGGTVSLRNSEELSADTAAAVVEISEGQHGVRVKLADKRAALVDLGRHLSLWNGRSIEIELPQIVTAADVSLALGRVVEAVASASITPEQGTALAAILETRRRAMELVEIENRLAALEARAA
jgi:phage terminase small subunit